MGGLLFPARWLERASRRLFCHFAGHSPSWVIGLGCGYDRPVCSVCRERL